jgi:hypothetical protein
VEEHESYLEAEREARRRTVVHVVVEVRDEDDAPGVEAAFVVCREDEIADVARGREVVFRAEIASVWSDLVRGRVDDALSRTNRALDRLDPKRRAVRDLLCDVRELLSSALETMTTARRSEHS